MALNIIKQTGTANTTYSPGRKIEWLFIHYSASTSSKRGAASGMCSWSANPAAGGSADFAVDDETMYQYNPDIKNRYCWAVGGGKYSYMSTSLGGKYYGIANNNNSINIELSSNKINKKSLDVNDNDWYLTDATINNGVKLAAYLMHLYNIDMSHVIMHHMRTGKWCPQPWTKNEAALAGWYDFLKRLQKEYDGTEYVAPVAEKLYRVRLSWDNEKSQLFAGTLTGAKQIADQNPGYSVFDPETKQAVYTSQAAPTIGNVSADNAKILASLPTYSGLPANKEDYLNKVAEICVKLYPHTKILPSVVIAMACLENGFGVASDAIALTSRNNLVGQKADLINSTWKQYSVWSGVSFTKRTPEDYGNGIVYVNDSFRVFNSYAESLLDFEMFLSWVKVGNQYKYRRVVGMTDPYEVISAIRAGIGTESSPQGYFTDKNYRTKIMNLINQYDLTKYDKIAMDGTDVPVATSPEVMTDTQVNPQSTSDVSLIVDRYKVGSNIKSGKIVDQKGAFTNLDNAKKLADQTGCKVFDMTNGACIYPETGAIVDGWYRVAKEYKNGQYVGQVGAYKNEANAIATAKSANLSCFDPQGNKIYPEPTPTPQKPISDASAQYQVRCGIFTKKKNAANLTNQLIAAGFSAILYEHDGQWYVQAGLFSNQSNADKLCSRIKAAGFDCVVTTI